MKIGGREGGGKKGAPEFSSTRKKECVMFSSFFQILLMGQKAVNSVVPSKTLVSPDRSSHGVSHKNSKVSFQFVNADLLDGIA